MHCPFCSALDTKVTDSRIVNSGSQVRRRRECLSCTERFTSYEVADLKMPQVIKQDGRRVNFDEARVHSGLKKALEKRPVSAEQIDLVLNKIKHRLRSSGEREIPSRTIGEWVMDELRQLDEVAYVRFASVYRSFQDVSQFSDEIKRLHQSEQEKRASVVTES